MPEKPDFATRKLLFKNWLLGRGYLPMPLKTASHESWQSGGATVVVSIESDTISLYRLNRGFLENGIPLPDTEEDCLTLFTKHKLP